MKLSVVIKCPRIFYCPEISQNMQLFSQWRMDTQSNSVVPMIGWLNLTVVDLPGRLSSLAGAKAGPIPPNEQKRRDLFLILVGSVVKPQVLNML
jgi:hypothetical protein